MSKDYNATWELGRALASSSCRSLFNCDFIPQIFRYEFMKSLWIFEVRKISPFRGYDRVIAKTGASWPVTSSEANDVLLLRCCEKAPVWFKIVAECKKDMLFLGGEFAVQHHRREQPSSDLMPISQWHSSRSEKSPTAVCRLLRSRVRCYGNNLGFSWPVHSSVAYSAKLDIVKVSRHEWLTINSKEPWMSQTKIMATTLGEIVIRSYIRWQIRLTEKSEASNCRTSYVFEDFIYNHTWSMRPTIGAWIDVFICIYNCFVLWATKDISVTNESSIDTYMRKVKQTI